jgi:hypothetical protein
LVGFSILYSRKSYKEEKDRMLYVVEYRFNGGGVGKNVGERGKGPMRFTGLEVEAFKLLRTIFLSSYRKPERAS